jgi:hypothetical protein
VMRPTVEWRVPKSPFPTVHRCAESRLFNVVQTVMLSCTRIYSMWYPVVETGDANRLNLRKANNHAGFR